MDKTDTDEELMAQITNHKMEVADRLQELYNRGYTIDIIVDYSSSGKHLVEFLVNVTKTFTKTESL